MEDLKTEIKTAIEKVCTLEELNEVRLNYIGKKGKITELRSN